MRHYNTLYSYRLGEVLHLTLTRRAALFLSDPPEPLPPDPPEPAPVDPPEPAPDPAPEPPPQPEPIDPPDPQPPEPPDPDPVKFDNLVFSGAVVIVNAKNPWSHERRGWFRVDDALLDQWQPQSHRHLLEILGKHATMHRGCVVFCLSRTYGWWDFVADATAVRCGALVVPN
jgi:hypothetical protein